MKKIISIIIVAVITLSLGACASTTQVSESEQNILGIIIDYNTDERLYDITDEDISAILAYLGIDYFSHYDYIDLDDLERAEELGIKECLYITATRSSVYEYVSETYPNIIYHEPDWLYIKELLDEKSGITISANYNGEAEGAGSSVNGYSMETYTSEGTLYGGYSYTATLKIGPWVKASDTESTNNIWQSIGGTGSIPFDSFTYNNWSSGIHFGEGTSIMAFGTIAIEDTTQGGFSIADSSQGISIDVYSQELSHATLVDSYAQTSSGSYLHSQDIRNTRVFHVSPGMNGRNWGPVPFVICANEALSPEYPDGKPDAINAIWKFGDNEFTIYPMWTQG